jgi:hypothetical protein
MIVLRGLVQGATVEQKIGEVPLAPTLKPEQSGAKETASDSLTLLIKQQPGSTFVFYSIDSHSSSGRSAGASDRVQLPLVATLPPPHDPQARIMPRGVALTWTVGPPPQVPPRLDSRYVLRVMRRLEGSTEPAVVANIALGSGPMGFLDSGIVWENHYDYWIVPVTLWDQGGKKGEVEGDNSDVLSVFAHDVFPPSTPAGLQAVSSGVPQQPGIDLTWSPDNDEDLAGYNVYRHSGGEQPVKINGELVKTPAFHDAHVQVGVKYGYSVSAVDLRGNESGRSVEASEAIPHE